VDRTPLYATASPPPASAGLLEHAVQATFWRELLQLSQAIVAGLLEGSELKWEVKPAGIDQLDQRVEAWGHRPSFVAADMGPGLPGPFGKGCLTQASAKAGLSQQRCTPDSVRTHSEILA
jgi:hypothetical protein